MGFCFSLSFGWLVQRIRKADLRGLGKILGLSNAIIRLPKSKHVIIYGKSCELWQAKEPAELPGQGLE